jgi:hypothetical protein
MNSHVKRWIDEIVNEMEIGQRTTASAIRETLVSKRGTTFVCDASAIGWYLKRKKNIKVNCMQRNRRVYMRV